VLGSIDQATVVAILAAFGIGVLGITEVLKSILKVSTWSDFARAAAGYVISLVVSAACTAYVLLTSSKWALGSFILYTIVVWAEANGIFKAVSGIVKKHA